MILLFFYHPVGIPRDDKGKKVVLFYEHTPPFFLLESEFSHTPEPEKSIDESHEYAHENIGRIVHTVVYTGESHDEYSQYPEKEKSALEISDNHDDKCRERHMARGKRWVLERKSYRQDIWVDRIRSESEYIEVDENCLEESFIYDEIDKYSYDQSSEDRTPEFMISEVEDIYDEWWYCEHGRDIAHYLIESIEKRPIQILEEMYEGVFEMIEGSEETIHRAIL